MSVISNIHTFTKLDKNSKPMTGQRLVRLIAKGENKSPNLAESMCVSIPLVSSNDVADVIDRLLPHVVGLVQDAQDKMIREYRIETGRNELPQDVIGLSEVVVWLDANAAGDRVSSEYLGEWFKEEYADAAHQYIAHVMGLALVNGEVPPIVEVKCNVLREMFTGWSSPKYSPSIPKLRAMIKFTDSIDELDSRMSALVTKAKAMLAKKEAELCDDALGF
jgi:hypothetical protein